MDGKIIVGTYVDTKGFEQGKKKIETEGKNINIKIDTDDLSNVGDKAKSMLDKLKSFGLGILGVLSKLLTGVLKIVTTVSLAFVGLIAGAGAIFVLWKAFQKVGEKLGQVKADLSYLLWTLEQALKPVINAVANAVIKALNWIVNLLAKIIYYISYIVFTLTGYDMLKNTGVDNYAKSMKNAEDSSKGTAKNIKEIKKQLAGFDEMNVLSDNKTSGGGGGIVDTDVKPFPRDLFSNIKIPKWLENITEFTKKHLPEVLSGILAIFTAIKLGFSGVQALGIGLAVSGIAHTIKSILEFIKKPTWKGFLNILEGIAMTITGIAILFGAWPVALIGALALIVVEVIKHWDKVKEIFMKFIDWLDEKFCGGLKALFNLVWDIITAPFRLAIDYVKNLFKGLYNGVKDIVDGVKKIMDGDFVGGITEILKGFGKILCAPFKALWEFAKDVCDEVWGWVQDIIDVVKSAVDWFKKLWNWDDEKSIDKMYRKTETYKKQAGKGGGGSSGGGFAKGGIVYHKLPKLAPGGIINQPGRGVPIGSAIGGERGREGVIPLTDSQQMALLGEAIGKYITINANIVNTMNGRVISRELQKINNESDFAFNR